MTKFKFLIKFRKIKNRKKVCILTNCSDARNVDQIGVRAEHGTSQGQQGMQESDGQQCGHVHDADEEQQLVAGAVVQILPDRDQAWDVENLI